MNLSRHAIALIALVSTAGSALAQYDPTNPNQEYQRRQKELQQQEKDKVDKQRLEEAAARDAVNYQALMESQRRLQEKLSGDVERDRALFMKTPPVPPQKNLLLGQWRLVMPKKKSGNAITDLNATLAGGVCEAVFGDGIWDFRPKAMYGIDHGIGETKLSDVDYRGNEGMIGVIPKMGKLFVFEILGPDRMQEVTSTRIGVEPCGFVRVGAGAQGASAPTASQAANPSKSGMPPAASGRAPASPPAQVASTAPTQSTLSRPSPEVCRNNLVDKLGTVGSNQVRAMSDVRFKEAAIEGKVPNTNNLRIDLRGSACDDPRIKATLYDFDANEMLQSITYVWERPAGPAPAPIFSERVTQLSRFHSLPPPQSPGRLQADTSLGRLIIEDMPERNLLLEAYKAKK